MAPLIDLDALYVTARAVLLDALAALGPHRDAIVLVGAQAVYQRVGAGSLAVAPFTTDGDLAIDSSCPEPWVRALVDARRACPVMISAPHAS